MKKIVIFGCGGHAKVVFDIIQSKSDFSVAAFFDNNPKETNFLGAPVFSDIQQLKNYANENQVSHAIVAIGNNDARKKLQIEAAQIGFNLPVLVHSSSIISSTANLGAGSVVFPGVIVNADAKIAEGCILNSGAIVEHDCFIGAFTHIAPGTVLCGGVSVGTLTLVGARSVVIPMMKVGTRATVGAGSVVVRDIPNDACAVGTPAKIKN
ncbi:acetyltransferase [Bdellovibrio sp. GT3]|uniref:acetyltransferase n=1 Tax=Bdellovibrio sp. GT3 TaxID=3136282 RepID=UPI0030F0B3B2